MSANSKNITTADEIKSPEITVRDSSSAPANVVNKLWALAGKLFWGSTELNLSVDISGKVDKEAGKSLVADSLISQIHAAHSDDQDISGKVDRETGKSLVADSLISQIHAAHSDDQDISGKVDKETGKSLVADSLISQIHAAHSDDQDLSGYALKDPFGLVFPTHDKIEVTRTGDVVTQLVFKLGLSTVSTLNLTWTGTTILTLAQTDTGKSTVTTTFTFTRDSEDNITSITKS